MSRAETLDLHDPPRRSVDWTSAALGVLLVLGVMVAPMVLIGQLTRPEPEGGGAVATGATAAIGVIFRASARSLLRSTFMMGVRATSRTVTRRVARAVLRSFMGLLLPAMNLPAEDARERRVAPAWFSVLVGFIALIASFRGVLALAAPEAFAALTLGSDPWLVSLIAATPLLLHAALMRLCAPRFGVVATHDSSVDGLLLQAYFTGAASFLPLASDVLLSGPRPAKAKCAAAVLLSLLASHFAFAGLAALAQAPSVSLLSSMCLLYAFVFVFPLQPLDGWDVWRWSRWGWLALFGLIVSCFMTRLPEAFVAIL